MFWRQNPSELMTEIKLKIDQTHTPMSDFVKQNHPTYINIGLKNKLTIQYI